MQRKLLAMATICVLVLSGCSGLTDKKEFSLFGEGRVNIAGANQMLDPNIETFGDEHLVTILNPDREFPAGKTFTVMDVERAFRDANTKPETHRNQVQERLILSSQQTCNFYKDYLRRIDAYKGFTLGSLTTALGAAAAIVTGAGAARALGGAAGITSGISAEFDQAFFKSIALHVIIPGIDSRRDKVLKRIREEEQSKSTDEYTVQAAVHDALVYHNQCTLNAGLEEAAESIKEMRDVGLTTALATMEKIQNLQASAQAIESGAGRVPKVVLPEGVFNRAKKQLDNLKKAKVAVEAAKPPEDLPPSVKNPPKDPEALKKKEAELAALKKEIDKANENKKELMKSIDDLVGDADKKLGDDGKKKIDKAQEGWQAVLVELESATDSQERVKARLKVKLQQMEAEEVRKEYEKLLKDLNGKLKEANAFLAQVKSLNSRAKEFQ